MTHLIGAWGGHSAEFLRILAVFTVFFFGLPMVLWPLRWAKVLGWKIPETVDLTVYFGRCLGCVICGLGLMTFCAASQPVLQPYFFSLLILLFVLMVVVHIYGAIRRIQPLSETVEILFWLTLVVLALLFYPVVIP